MLLVLSSAAYSFLQGADAQVFDVKMAPFFFIVLLLLLVKFSSKQHYILEISAV